MSILRWRSPLAWAHPIPDPSDQTLLDCDYVVPLGCPAVQHLPPLHGGLELRQIGDLLRHGCHAVVHLGHATFKRSLTASTAESRIVAIGSGHRRGAESNSSERHGLVPTAAGEVEPYRHLEWSDIGGCVPRRLSGSGFFRWAWAKIASAIPDLQIGEAHLTVASRDHLCIAEHLGGDGRGLDITGVGTRTRSTRQPKLPSGCGQARKQMPPVLEERAPP